MGVRWEPKSDHRSHVPKDRRKRINFMGMVSPSSAISTSAAFKLNKTSMAPLQNMVISLLHETWKKEGVPFKGQTRSTIQHPHCHLSPKEVSSKKQWMKGWWASPLGCPGHAGLPGCCKSHSWVRIWQLGDRGVQLHHQLRVWFNCSQEKRIYSHKTTFFQVCESKNVLRER